MRFARVQMKLKQGVDLPPARGVLGIKTNWFWTEVLQRERRERVEMLNYMPAVAYLMSGVDQEVPFGKRDELLQPFRKRMHDYITHDAYTTESRRRKLIQKIEELEEKKRKVDRLEAMSNKNFLDKWLAGDV